MGYHSFPSVPMRWDGPFLIILIELVVRKLKLIFQLASKERVKFMLTSKERVIFKLS